jgi:anti-sigma regulatory factor (Ser/Thr protein kinase)
MELAGPVTTRREATGDRSPPREWHGTIAGGELAPARARRALEHFAPGLAGRQLDAARLLITEVVGNCVRHGGAGPRETIELSLSSTESTLFVRVGDHGCGFEPDPHPVPPDDTGEGGRGLYLVDVLASRWGVRRDGLTVVWFELPI